MKKVTKFLSLVLVLAMVVSCLAACGSKNETKDEKKEPAAVKTEFGEQGKVLNIYCWNEEFKQRLEELYPGYTKVDAATGKIGDVTVKWNITPSENNAYQQALDNALKQQGSASADDKVDLFLIEADYALKYVEPNVSHALAEVGIDVAKDFKNQYTYTQDIVKDSKGNIKGTSWQGCPAALIYRTDIAEEVLGTSDVDKVQEYVKDWASFEATAAKMKEKGYTMVAGFDDTYRVFSNNVKSAWVNGTKVQIDDRIWEWVEQTKKFTDNGYNVKDSLWGDNGWKSGFDMSGKVFCYFGPAWFIDFCMNCSEPGSVGEAGKWHITVGPEGYFWGGTWICAAAGTDNEVLIKDIMMKMTADTDTLVKLAQTFSDFVNDQPAMEKLAADNTVGNKYLGGQNIYGILAEGAKKIHIDYASAYDQGCNEKFQAAMKEYYLGNCTKEEALENFKKEIKTLYPELNTDDLKVK